jgi:hypothetical protein
MKKLNSTLIIEQIYNFVLEKPYFQSKSQFMQLHILFKELHEGDNINFESIKPYTFKGVFNGIYKVISTHTAPTIADKQEFIGWVAKQFERDN